MISKQLCLKQHCNTFDKKSFNKLAQLIAKKNKIYLFNCLIFIKVIVAQKLSLKKYFHYLYLKYLKSFRQFNDVKIRRHFGINAKQIIINHIFSITLITGYHNLIYLSCKHHCRVQHQRFNWPARDCRNELSGRDFLWLRS